MVHSTPKHTGGQSLLKAVLKGTLMFLILAVVATLRFTSVAPLLIMLCAAGIGFYGSYRLGRREFVYAGLVTIPANLLLQILYFADVGPFLDTVDIIILATLNIAILAGLALLGGLVAYVLRRRREHKEHLKRQAEERKNDTRWIDRLVVSVVLVFYLAVYVFPVVQPVVAAPSCPTQNLMIDGLVECYEPDTQFSTKGTSVEPKVQRNMTLDGAEALYEQYPEVPKEVIDNLLIQCGSIGCDISAGVAEYKESIASIQIYDSIGVPPWQQTYPEAYGFTQGLWNSTIGGLITFGKALKQDFWGTAGLMVQGAGNALHKAKMLTDPAYAGKNIAHAFRNEIGSYYGAAVKKIKNGQVWQGIGDMFNVPKLVGSVIDKRYAGGIKQLAKDVRNPDKITQWAVNAGVISPETGRAIQQKQYRYAIGNGVGEVAGAALTYAFGSAVASGVGRVARGLTKQTVVSATIKSGVPKSKIVNVANDIEGYLGEGAYLHKNSKPGNPVFMSSDGKKRVRFDLADPAPHKNPHAHVEYEITKGKWKKSGQLYPNDVPKE